MVKLVVKVSFYMYGNLDLVGDNDNFGLYSKSTAEESAQGA